MRRPWTPVVLAVMAATGASAQEVHTFATGVETVYVDVWVGQGETPVSGLSASDFAVTDEGVPQDVELVDTSRVPLHTVLVFDTSASVAGRPLEALTAAARSFLEGLAPADHATLVTFSHVRRLQGPVAGEPGAVAAALSGVFASGATALYDAVYTGLRLTDPRWGRPVVMVFSDGADRVSWLSAEAVEAAARESEATVYVVDSGWSETLHVASRTEGGRLDNDKAGPRPQLVPSSGSGRTAYGGYLRAPVLVTHETPVFLRHVAEETGGAVFTAGRAESLDESFLAVLARVKSRYLLRYQPAGVEAGGWHKLDVRLKDRKGDVRARKGYFVAPAPPSD
jgi:Ca-activated chloride channel family protein